MTTQLEEIADDARLLPVTSEPSDQSCFPMLAQAAELLGVSRAALEDMFREDQVRSIQTHRGAKRRFVLASNLEWATLYSRVEYEWLAGADQPAAILRASYRFRDNSVVTEPCPFCGRQHLHGHFTEEGGWRYAGHRGSHCDGYVGEEGRTTPIRVFARDGKRVSMSNGYVLRPPVAVHEPLRSLAQRGLDV